MKAEMRRRIQMTFIGSNGLMRLKMGCRIRERTVLIELMSKHFPKPKCVRQRAGEQCEHHRVAALAHVGNSTRRALCQSCFQALFPEKSVTRTVEEVAGQRAVEVSTYTKVIEVILGKWSHKGVFFRNQWQQYAKIHYAVR